MNAINGAELAEIEGPQPETTDKLPDLSKFPPQFAGVGVTNISDEDMTVTVSLVATARGLIPRCELLLKQSVYEQQNALVIALEWFHGFHPEAEMVRRDVIVTMLTGHPAGMKQGQVGG